MAKKKSSYTYNEDQLGDQLKAYPHLVQDCLNVIQANADSNAENTQGSVCVALRGQDRYKDVSKTKMIKLVASLVSNNRLAGWVSQRKHGFVPADKAKTAAPKASKSKSKTSTKKNKGGRPTIKQQIEKEEREKALTEYRAKVRARIRKQYGLD